MQSRLATVAAATALGTGIGAAAAGVICGLLAFAASGGNPVTAGIALVIAPFAGLPAGLLSGLAGGLVLVGCERPDPARLAERGWWAGLAAAGVIVLEGIGYAAESHIQAVAVPFLLAAPIALLTARYYGVRLLAPTRAPAASTGGVGARFADRDPAVPSWAVWAQEPLSARTDDDDQF